jgi:hypothetical protein
LGTGCLLEVLKGMSIVVSAWLELIAEIIFSFLVVLAPEFGKLACSNMNCYTSWSELIDEGCRAWKSKSLMGTICRLILSSAVYWLWRARNELKVGGQPLIEE